MQNVVMEELRAVFTYRYFFKILFQSSVPSLTTRFKFNQTTSSNSGYLLNYVFKP